MIKLLEKILKMSPDEGSPESRRVFGVAASVIGVLINLLLFAGKLMAGMLSGAISLTADAFNNLSDAGSQIISFVSFKISAKPPDREHPFGHARIEYVASMIVSFLVLIVGYELFSESLSKLINPEPPSGNALWLSIVVLGLSMLGKLWLGLFNRRLGRRIESPVMQAAAADSFSDVLSSGAVMVGLIAYMTFGWTWADPLVGFAVAVMIFIAGIKILNDTKNSILGEPPSDEIVTNIRRIVDEYPEISGIHDMVIHNYGPGRVIASLHLEVDGKRDIFETHDIIDNIERRIASELSIAVTIHMDPVLIGDCEVDRLKALTEKAVEGVDSRLKIHDFRCVAGPTHTNLIFDISAPFEVGMSDEEITEKVQSSISGINPAYFTVINIDRE